jgi:hypothetical protein
VLDASDRLTMEDLSNITYEDLVTEKTAKVHLPVKPAPPWNKEAPKT